MIVASGRRPQPGCDRLALIIDPEGIVRLIIHRPLPNIESALLDIERELDRLQGKVVENEANGFDPLDVIEQLDATGKFYKAEPAYFPRTKINQN